MFSTRSWMLVLIAASLLWSTAARADEDDPALRGKKLSEWIELLQNGKTVGQRRLGLIAVQVIGPRKSRKVTPALIAALRENSEETIRSGAARALGEIASKSRDEDDLVLDKIRNALAAALRSDKKVAVRRAAATALGEMKGGAIKAVDDLALALKDTDAGTRTAAARSLHQLGPNADEALGDLQTALKNAKLERLTRAPLRPCSGPHWQGGVRARLEGHPRRQQERHRTAPRCAEALGQLGEKATDAVPALAAALTAKDSEVVLRRAAAESLDRMGSEAGAALSALRKAFKDEDQFVRSLSLHAISHLGRDLGDDRKLVINGILAAMDDNVLEVRITAIEALGNLGTAGLGDQSKAAVTRLTAATRDPQKAVSEAAKVALKKLQGS